MFIAVATACWVMVGKKSPLSLVRFGLSLWSWQGYVFIHHLMHLTVPFPWPSWSLMVMALRLSCAGVYVF